MSKTEDNRKLIQFRAQPDTVRRIEQWYEADGCRSRNEFIERAVTYYTDALALMDSSLLPCAKSSANGGRKKRESHSLTSTAAPARKARAAFVMSLYL